MPARKIFGRDRLSIAYGRSMESPSKGGFGKFDCYRHSSPSQGGKWFFVTLWPAGLAEYDEMEGLPWKWPSIDGGIAKAALVPETVGPKPAKFVSRQPWSRLVTVVSRANQPDVSQLEIVLDEIVIERPDDIEQQLGGDNGYDGDPA